VWITAYINGCPEKKLVINGKSGRLKKRESSANILEKEMAMRAATDLKEAHSGEIFLEHKRKVGRLYIYI
jgi:hypothetical protein